MWRWIDGVLLMTGELLLVGEKSNGFSRGTLSLLGYVFTGLN
jgi:hypothetical protein